MSRQPREEIALLRTTPAAGAIGTCRYKLADGQEEDFERIVDVLQAHDVGWFFYIGGNDSMDTAHKVSRLARDRGVDLVCTGVPKTIDNDVGDEEFRLIDHTPGYGSAARYWAHHHPGRGRGEPGHVPLGARDRAAGHGAQVRLHPGRRPPGRPGAAHAAAALPGRGRATPWRPWRRT